MHWHNCSSKEKSNRYIVLSWLLLLLVYGVYYQYDFSATRMLRIANYPLRTLFPLWGTYNMMFTCKNLCTQINSLPSSKVYSYLKANSYEFVSLLGSLELPLDTDSCVFPGRWHFLQLIRVLLLHLWCASLVLYLV